VVSFLFLFACDNSNIVRSEGLSVYFFCFLPIFDWELFLFFCFLPIFDRGFLFFFCFLPIFDRELPLFWKRVSSSIVNDFFLGRPHCSVFRGQGWKFSSWVKVYGGLKSWLKACRTAGHDICQGVGLASGLGIKGMSHIISMIHMQQ